MRKLVLLLAALLLTGPAGAAVRIADFTATVNGDGSANAGQLTCFESSASGPGQFSDNFSCHQPTNFCKVFEAINLARINDPFGPDPRLVEDVKTFAFEAEAVARSYPQTCRFVSSVQAQSSSAFSVRFDVDVPTKVELRVRLGGGADLAIGLPGYAHPGGDEFYETTLLAEPPGFTIGGSLAAAVGGTDANREDAKLVQVSMRFTKEKSRPPVVLVPGIGGTYASSLANDSPWLFVRGVPPALTQVDPLAGAYDDILQTLRNVGYRDGVDLFVVNYDWRLPPGPVDGAFDGVIHGLTPASISDTTYEYAVDYLGNTLRRAAERWAEDHPDEPLEGVDVIAHSTGGLVARTYIQSTAYGGEVDQDLTLPRVRNLFLVGVPNRGASKAWNPLHDNWVVDPAYVVVLSKMLNRVYQKVVRGAVVPGPFAPILLSSITDPATQAADPTLFIRQYVPTIRALLATYDFLDRGAGLGHVNADPALRNDWLLDLNAGFDLQPTLDPVPFADHCEATVIYGTNVSTPTTVRERVGPAGDRTIASFADFVPRKAEPGETWYLDVPAPINGDGTVPIDSSAGLFFGDSRVSLAPFTRGGNTAAPVSHLALMFNPDVQALILSKLGVPFDPSDLSTSLHLGDAEALWAGRNIIQLGALITTLDPVEGFVTDGAGRRLGFTAATGPLSEIPGSRWIGNADGFGFVLGRPAGPFELQLQGLGGDHYAAVSVLSPAGLGGVVDDAPLGPGAERRIPIPIPEPADGAATALAVLLALRIGVQARSARAPRVGARATPATGTSSLPAPARSASASARPRRG